MQCLNNLLALLFLYFRSCLVLVQEAVQIRVIHKKFRAYEVQQHEQLFQAILQWHASDQESPTGDECSDDLRKNGIDILDSVSFVDYNIFETEFLEGGFLDQADLVARYTNFEILRDESVRDDLCALFLGTSKDDDVHVGGPLLEFPRPVLKR
jgi:hypothetical protein